MKETTIKERPVLAVKARPSLMGFFGWSGRFVGFAVILASAVQPEVLWADVSMPARLQGALIGFCICLASEVLFHRVYIEAHQRATSEHSRDVARYLMRIEAHTRETSRNVNRVDVPESLTQR